MHLFSCTHCGQRVFFENTDCGACGAKLGFVPAERQMIAFTVGDDGAWSRVGPTGPAQRPCGNYTAEGVCNWMLRQDDPEALCVCCRTTEIIPALNKPENRARWQNLEQAKRRLFYTLLALKLPAPNKTLDPVNGLSFQFLEETDSKQRVLTGHDNGVITLNIAEADDAEREKMRAAMHEPYRTLVGHFRHESGHYYWDRLVDKTAWIDEYRQLFGDEREDYATALQKHYESPPTDWNQNFISVYASSHPWEDWAETWAHYLHLVDGLETAAAWGLRLDNATPNGPPLQVRQIDPTALSIESDVVEHWLPVAQFSNAMNRSMGVHDSYPFVVPAPVVARLNFVHRVVRAAALGEMPMNYSSPEAVRVPTIDLPQTAEVMPPALEEPAAA